MAVKAFIHDYYWSVKVIINNLTIHQDKLEINKNKTQNVLCSNIQIQEKEQILLQSITLTPLYLKKCKKNYNFNKNLKTRRNEDWNMKNSLLKKSDMIIKFEKMIQ